MKTWNAPCGAGKRIERGRAGALTPVIAAALLALLSGPTRAESCDSMAAMVADVWNAFMAEAEKIGCLHPVKIKHARLQTCSAARIKTGLVGNMVGWWNNVAKNRWATLGPRSVGPEWQEGTVVGPTARTFVGMAPEFSASTVLLRPLGGSGPADVTLCGFDETGRAVKLAERRVDAGSAKTVRLDARQAIGHILAVKIKRSAVTGNFKYKLRIKTTPVEWDYRASGFADIHVHQAAEMAHGGLWYWGSHTGKARQALPACSVANAAQLAKTHFTRAESQDLHALPIDLYRPKSESILRHGEGFPSFDSWPHFTDVSHQQVHADWLKQAHDRGLNLVVVSAVNNEPFCKLLKVLYPNKTEHPCDDTYNLTRQIQAFMDFDRDHDWYEIAVHPWHARKIIHEGKLAVVVSLESSHLFPRKDGDFVKQLDELYAMGLRTLQLAHETDSQFAGSAPHRIQFELFQAAKWPQRMLGSLASLDLSGYSRDNQNKNTIGLTADGKRLVDAMVQRRMLVDVSHLSEKSKRDLYNLVTSEYDSYPFYESHSRFKSLLFKPDLETQKEFLTTDEQVDMIRDVGGMVGIRTGYNAIQKAKNGIANTCSGSSRSIAQMVAYAADQGLDIAFGTDLNGNTHQVGPRYGLDACFAARELGLGQNKPQGDRLAGVSEAFNTGGLAHIGLLPDLLADMKGLETPGAAELEDSAETFIRMWEKAYDVALPVATNEPEGCQADDACPDGWYCDQGIAGLGVGKCKSKLTDGGACTKAHQCAGGRCRFAGVTGYCSTANSVAFGAGCRFDDECRQGTCSGTGLTKGTCVCDADGDCESGQYCNKGVGGIGKNVCANKLADGKACTKDHQCGSGHCSGWRPQDGQVSGICYSPDSVAAGGSCRIDLECKTGKCNSKKTCVCDDDGDCGKGFWCDKGLDLSQNSCKAKLGLGEVCGTVGEVGVGHRCKSGKCKVAGLTGKLKCK